MKAVIYTYPLGDNRVLKWKVKIV